MKAELVVRGICSLLMGLVVYFLLLEVGGWPFLIVLAISAILGILIGLI